MTIRFGSRLALSNIFMLVALLIAGLLTGLLTGCSAENRTATAEPMPDQPPPSAAPLAKPHQKLGVEMHHLSQQRTTSLVKQARQRELLVKEGMLLVQLAYEGSEEQVVAALESLGIPVVHRFPRFQRLDVSLRSYTDLDAVISLGSVYRIEALRVPMVRTDSE